MALSPLNIKNKLAAARAKREAELAAMQAFETGEQLTTQPTATAQAVAVSVGKAKEQATFSKNEVTRDMLNSEQLQAIIHGEAGESFCLIGSAGTGKTTTQRVLVRSLQDSGKIGFIADSDSKYIITGMPSVAVISFTNKAVNNIRAALPDEFKSNAVTIHSILEYHPEFEEVDDVDSHGLVVGKKNSMRFIPKFGKNKEGFGDGFILPHIDVVIVEEAGSVPLDLWDNFVGALPNGGDDTLFIFLGDLNQLPPVFGDAILGFKLLDLPIVELKTPYRAALESPITCLANKLKDGTMYDDDNLKKFEELNANGKGKITIHPFTGRARGASPEKMAASFGTHVYNWIMNGDYDVTDSVVLMPYNKAFGTIEINRWIGQALADKSNLPVHHVIAGESNHFFCVGDRVLFDKQECEIVSIEPNKSYVGVPALAASRDLNRWGKNTGDKSLAMEQLTVDELLERHAEANTGEKVRQASHTIKMRGLYEVNGAYPELTAETAGEVNSMLFLWALSVHKSQGSEWRRVVFVIHESHKIMWKREILYTAITRAREELEIYFTGQTGASRNSSFQIGVRRSEYDATSLDGKLDYFRRQRMKSQLAAKRNPLDLSKYSKGL